MTIEIVNYANPNEQAKRPALVRDGGRKWLYIMQLDYPLRVRKVAKTERRHMSELSLTKRNGTAIPYPLNRAVRKFVAFGRGQKISKATRGFLKEATEQVKATPAQSQ